MIITLLARSLTSPLSFVCLFLMIIIIDVMIITMINQIAQLSGLTIVLRTETEYLLSLLFMHFYQSSSFCYFLLMGLTLLLENLAN